MELKLKENLQKNEPTLELEKKHSTLKTLPSATYTQEREFNFEDDNINFELDI